MSAEFDIESFKQSIDATADNLSLIIKKAHQHKKTDDEITNAVQAMINNGVKPFGECLQKAACFGYIKLARLLLDNEVKVNTRDRNRNTPLINACHTNHFDVAVYLVEKGAYINARNKYGWTALKYACASNRKELVKYLIEHGADTYIIHKDGHNIISKLESINKKDKYKDMIKYLTEIKNSKNEQK